MLRSDRQRGKTYGAAPAAEQLNERVAGNEPYWGGSKIPC
jgi:hypothetical protein